MEQRHAVGNELLALPAGPGLRGAERGPGGAEDGNGDEDEDGNGDGGLTRNSMLHEIDQPGVGPVLAAATPLEQDGRLEPSPASRLGADTADVLTGLLGLSAPQIRDLAERGVTG